MDPKKDDNVIPLLKTVGWCVAIFEHNTTGSYMFWDRVQEGFNGLATINSIFSDEDEANNLMKKNSNSPYMDCKVFEIEHIYTGMNRDIVINVKVGDSFISV